MERISLVYGICRSFKAFNLPALGTCLDFNFKSTQVEIAVPATFQAHQKLLIRAWNKSHVAIQLELQLFFLPKEPQAELRSRQKHRTPWSGFIGIQTSTIWLFNIAMENPPIFKFGKPSISMGHLYHGKLLVITRPGSPY